MSFTLLREVNIKRKALWSGQEHMGSLFRALEVGGETGELQEAVKKHYRQANGITGTQASVEDIKDEIGDVLVSLDLLAQEYDIDLSSAWQTKFNKTSIKYGLPIIEELIT